MTLFFLQNNTKLSNVFVLYCVIKRKMEKQTINIKEKMVEMVFFNAL